MAEVHGIGVLRFCHFLLGFAFSLDGGLHAVSVFLLRFHCGAFAAAAAFGMMVGRFRGREVGIDRRR